MMTLRQLSKNEKLEYSLIFGIIIISIFIGIFVSQNEEWFVYRNFSAGYMSGSLLAAVLLFSVYRTIAFIIDKVRKKKES